MPNSLTEHSPAQVFAASVVAELVASGVNDFFIAPGARSQAITVALGQLAAAGSINLHVRLDERSLAFTALGASLGAFRQPVAMVTTSGTAVANLHPAVLEAHHSGVPLILLTADRPHELRGVGANQTTNQVGIFGDAVVKCFDVAAPSEADLAAGTLKSRAKDLVAEAMALCQQSQIQAGPVQLNLAFREPLSGLTPNAQTVLLELFEASGPIIETSEEDSIQNDAMDVPVAIDYSRPTIVIAGAGPNYSAASHGVPIFAEPSSGLRGDYHSVNNYRFLIEQRPDLVDQIEQIIVVGKPTLSRPVLALLRRPGIRVYVEKSIYGHFDIYGNATQIGNQIEVLAEPDEDWLQHWLQVDAAFVAPKSEGFERREIIEEVWLASQVQSQLLLGASRMIREADFWAPPVEIEVFANRGLAGIDGTIATATGLALSNPELTTRALIGDLTFLHDVGSLVIDPVDGQLDLQLIVVNDNGGSIFESLEMAKTLDRESFVRLFKTPQIADLQKLAEAYGWRHVLAKTALELRSALKENGRIVIEVALA